MRSSPTTTPPIERLLARRTHNVLSFNGRAASQAVFGDPSRIYRIAGGKRERLTRGNATAIEQVLRQRAQAILLAADFIAINSDHLLVKLASNRGRNRVQRRGPIRDSIVRCIEAHPEGIRGSDIARKIGNSQENIAHTILNLVQRGFVRKIERGLYGPVTTPPLSREAL